jgi:hypothetical protein
MPTRRSSISASDPCSTLLDTENELLNARRTAVNSDMDLGIAYLRTQAGIGRLLEFLGVRPRGLDDEIHRELDSAGEICPPQAPGSYLVDLEALDGPCHGHARSQQAGGGACATPPRPCRRPIRPRPRLCRIRRPCRRRERLHAPSPGRCASRPRSRLLAPAAPRRLYHAHRVRAFGDRSGRTDADACGWWRRPGIGLSCRQGGKASYRRGCLLGEIIRWKNWQRGRRLGLPGVLTATLVSMHRPLCRRWLKPANAWAKHRETKGWRAVGIQVEARAMFGALHRANVLESEFVQHIAQRRIAIPRAKRCAGSRSAVNG